MYKIKENKIQAMINDYISKRISIGQYVKKLNALLKNSKHKISNLEGRLKNEHTK